jgi:DNA-binding response OmpR family regulator
LFGLSSKNLSLDNFYMPKILIIEDESELIKVLKSYLEQAGYQVFSARRGDSGLVAWEQNHPDLVILDLNLPGMDGLDVARAIRRKSTVPILMLTARVDETDQIVGLELGADDYLSKPFNPRELVARVKAILRRGTYLQQSGKKPLHVGDLVIDPVSRDVLFNGQALELRTQEFDLLLTFAEHKGQVLTREQLLELAWGFDYYGQTRTVDVHVGHLRRKLAGSNVQIETITGVGYKLVV